MPSLAKRRMRSLFETYFAKEARIIGICQGKLLDCFTPEIIVWPEWRFGETNGNVVSTCFKGNRFYRRREVRVGEIRPNLSRKVYLA